MRIWQFFSAAIAIFGPAVIIAYDMLAKQYAGKDATITAVVQEWQHQYPEMAYACAGLFVWVWCHLFFEGIAHRIH